MATVEHLPRSLCRALSPGHNGDGLTGIAEQGSWRCATAVRQAQRRGPIRLRRNRTSEQGQNLITAALLCLT